MVGERYGKLVVIEEYITTLDNGTRKRVSKCKCDCGNFITVITGNLKSGNTKSCGCSRQKAIKNMIDKHNKEWYLDREIARVKKEKEHNNSN